MTIDEQLSALAVTLGDAFQGYEQTAQQLADESAQAKVDAEDAALAAGQARDQSAAWAEGVEPGGVGTASAKHHALAAEAARDVAIASAAETAIRFYPSHAAFEANPIPVGVDHVVINMSGEMVSYLRVSVASGADDLPPHPDGSQWAKASLTTADLLAAVTDVIVAGRFPTYVEGTFLPELTWADKVAGTVNYGSRFGSYVRLGRMVYVDMSFFGVTVVRGTEAGPILVAKLPYEAAANTYGTLQLRRSEGINLRDTDGKPPASVAALIVPGHTYGVLTITPADAASFSAGVARCSAAANAVTLQLTGWYEVQD